MAQAIHPTAIIAPDAVLGDAVEIGAYSVIGSGVEIGARTFVGPHVVICGPTRIGEDNRIHQYASVGDAPQDKKYKGEPTRLEIGHRNVIREFTTLNRGTTKDQHVTRIGDDNLFMSYTHVAHDCVVGNQCVLANCATLGGHVQLGDWVIMAGFSGIHQFCKVGAHAFIANNSAVTRDVPPYVMAVGQPATPHSVNAEGLKRRGFTPEQIRNIRNAFRVLYRSGLKLAEAETQLKAMAQESPEIQPLVDFLPQSTRSIVR
jgi:UDP-N-acetylglucosamine acyltransferase